MRKREMKTEMERENIGAIALIVLIIIFGVCLNNLADSNTRKLEKAFQGIEYTQAMEILYGNSSK